MKLRFVGEAKNYPRLEHMAAVTVNSVWFQAHADEIHILLAVVRYKTVLHKPRLGLCSNWLASLSANSPLHIAVKKGSFTFPTEKVSFVSIFVQF